MQIILNLCSKILYILEIHLRRINNIIEHFSIPRIVRISHTCVIGLVALLAGEVVSLAGLVVVHAFPVDPPLALGGV